MKQKHVDFGEFELTQIMLVVGTRPEVIKMAPVMDGLRKIKASFVFVHTGQHYDYNMSRKMIEDLRLPSPDYSFKLRISSPTEIMAQMMLKLRKVMLKEGTRLVLVEGDTNTIAAAALTALKMGARIGHVESGLRSRDWRMPEEHNRIMVDHISDLLFAPTLDAGSNLATEHVHGRVFVTGNTVIDAVVKYMPLAEKTSRVLETISYKQFVLVTAHRAENVDNPVVLKELVETLVDAPFPIVFPAHPRTVKRLHEFDLYSKIARSANVQVLPPAGYLDLLLLMKKCEAILTDSGGLQEETTAPPIRKRLVVFRKRTERPEAVKAGFARVAGVTKTGALRALNMMLSDNTELPPRSPYGNGRAGDKIANKGMLFLRTLGRQRSPT
jgi:UDP-N-acetylglucosamine 2-epimerase (non-hydrolysing)